jgi:hypothetical protein
MEISIEDIFTSKNCKKYNYTTPLEMKSHGCDEVTKLPWHYWVLVVVNIIQLGIIGVLLTVGFTVCKRKHQSSDIKVALEHDFEIIENDMYGVTAEDGSK